MRPPRCPLFEGARGVRIYSSARVRIRHPNPHPLPRYAAPSHSRRGLFHSAPPRSQSPPPPPLRCPLPLPEGGLKCILDEYAVFSPFPAPSPALAPVRPRPFAPPSHGARPSRQLGLPPPAPGGGIKTHLSHKKNLIVRPPCPDNLRPIFFPPRCRSSAFFAPASQRRQTSRHRGVFMACAALDAIVKVA